MATDRMAIDQQNRTMAVSENPTDGPDLLFGDAFNYPELRSWVEREARRCLVSSDRLADNA